MAQHVGDATAVQPQGAFELRESVDFGFGPREAEPGSTVMRLGFVLDGSGEPAGVAVRQEPSGQVRFAVTGTDEVRAACGQAARILSLDVDARGWDELGRRDRFVGRLQSSRPGLRPPLFASAYEALVWAVLSARRPRAQMVQLRDALCRRTAPCWRSRGGTCRCCPGPDRLLAVRDLPSLPKVKLRRLHGVAAAALRGELDTAGLRALPAAEAARRLQLLEGIGPFYSELVTVRALGHTDVLPTCEPRVLEVGGVLTGLGRPWEQSELVGAAEAWRPWRTWAVVALRAAGPRLLGDA